MQNNVKTFEQVYTVSSAATNAVIKNTYALLAMSLLFSAITAFMGVAFNINMPLPLFIIGSFGLLYITNKFCNSAIGLLGVFAFAGFMGLSLGPVINQVLYLANGAEIVGTALALTAVIFFALSGYAMVTKKDFSYLTGFLFAGFTVVFVASLLFMLFNIPILYLAVSSAVILLSSGYILLETSQMINGGQRNYILATISLYLSIYNIFVNLLQLLAILSGRRE